MYKHLEPFPHPDPKIRFMDRAIFIVAALGPISTIPQVYDIFVHKDAAGVSPVTWSIYFLLSFVWLSYGILHKEKAIIFSNALWILMNGLVALGAIIY